MRLSAAQKAPSSSADGTRKINLVGPNRRECGTRVDCTAGQPKVNRLACRRGSAQCTPMQSQTGRTAMDHGPGSSCGVCWSHHPLRSRTTPRTTVPSDHSGKHESRSTIKEPPAASSGHVMAGASRPPGTGCFRNRGSDRPEARHPPSTCPPDAAPLRQRYRGSSRSQRPRDRSAGRCSPLRRWSGRKPRRRGGRRVRSA